MSKVPLIIPKYRDELLFSYVHRLKKINMFTDEVFIDDIMQLKRVHKEDRCPDYDTRYCLLPLIKALGVKDPVDFYLSTSMYSGISPFLSEADKANLIGKVLSDYNNFPLLFPPIKQVIKDLKICPKCAEEEMIKNGEFYLHRAHQLNGVNLCHKHDIPLKMFKGALGEEFDINKYEDMPLSEDLEFDRLYAQFAYILFSPFTKSKLPFKSLFDSHSDYFDFLDEVQDKVCANLPNYCKADRMKLHNNISYYLLHGKIKDKLFTLPKRCDYTIQRSYGDNIFLCKCKTCKKYFVSTKFALELGISCPCHRYDINSVDFVNKVFNDNKVNRFTLIPTKDMFFKNGFLLFDNSVKALLTMDVWAYFSGRFDDLLNKPYYVRKKVNVDPTPFDLDKLGYNLLIDNENLVIECKNCGYRRDYTLKRNSYIPPCPKCTNTRPTSKVKSKK